MSKDQDLTISEFHDLSMSGFMDDVFPGCQEFWNSVVDHLRFEKVSNAGSQDVSM